MRGQAKTFDPAKVLNLKGAKSSSASCIFEYSTKCGGRAEATHVTVVSFFLYHSLVEMMFEMKKPIT